MRRPLQQTRRIVEKINDIIKLVVDAHAGQVDKQGLPYIFHVLRVGLRGNNEDEIVVGFLHDILEDTAVDAAGLVASGLFTDPQIEAVVAVSRVKEETYMNYIRRLCDNPIAREVKWNDLTDNLSRIHTLDEEVRGHLLKRYARAKQIIHKSREKDLNQIAALPQEDR